ncbi:GCN5 family acetyltransferase [Nocardiopsis terrae]|uniref:Ribosomal protein S18 acetylase RimI-like enzyme n=1 Tax=Nocardiopsis terrae TaxID=372655 RepID=A0ABR9HJ89_9ACTN|nr:GNAT family N-acetyltransferase [Nocardiopsis terrae]MBE1459073.1 ribosomal protein S18 acetylase RimI-like enzyme [Nocardiopsis terrae]GHC87963.1 GCN5 family acetyltransferase [Nocardiopsis terrae]
MFDIHPAVPGDAGELLTLQRAAYVDEAQAYGDPFILPLTEGLPRIERLLADEDTLVLKALAGHRLVGAVRAGTTDTTGVVGRLVVAPDLRGRGIARALLSRVEEDLRAHRPDLRALTLFTGAQSAQNQRLYRALGYAETHRERMADHLVLVHMRKELDEVSVGSA